MPRTDYLLADGTKAPGVTTVLKAIGYGSENIIGWANNLGLKDIKYRTELSRLGDIGTCAHTFFEESLTQKITSRKEWPDHIVDAGAPCRELFKRWRVGKRVKVYTSELRLLSERWRVGGTLDMVARINDGPLVLIDFKTSSGIRPTYLAQVAAYVDMLEEHHGKTVASALIVRFGKDGHCDELEVSGDLLDLGRELFQRALWLHNAEARIDSAIRNTIVRVDSLKPVKALAEPTGSTITYTVDNQ